MSGRSRYYDGRLYAAVLDRLLAGVHARVAALVPDGCRAVDLGCGTGALAVRLATRAKGVVGVDRSPAMVAFAQQRRVPPLEHVRFVLGDASQALATEPDGAFDVATMVMVLHEMPEAARALVLTEAARLATRVLCVDFVSPMPRNLAGVRNRCLELAAGREHFGGYLSFQRGGGVPAVASAAGLACSVVRLADRGTLGFFEVSRRD